MQSEVLIALIVLFPVNNEIRPRRCKWSLTDACLNTRKKLRKSSFAYLRTVQLEGLHFCMHGGV